MKDKVLGIGFLILLLGFILIGVYEQKNRVKEIEVLVIEEKPIEIITVVSVEEVKEEKEEMKEVIKAWDDIPLTAQEQVQLYDKCEELHISFWLVLALLESESNYKMDAVGDNGKSFGYMQINEVNWYRMKREYGLDVFEPIDNLYCGCYIVAELVCKYDTPEEVIMAYKCGESRARELRQRGLVLTCVEEVVNRAIELENLHREGETNG